MDVQGQKELTSEVSLVWCFC